MNLTEGTKLHGFIITRVRPVKELSGTLIEMLHEKTGAGLCYLDNGEENKLFSVAFQTIPEDSTGVFHILEHSVLCGSEKYPVKEPFVELLKSSMNTFLNAMTYPDKTVYPISSRNEKDFLNLTSVYLDAVFAPNLLHNPNIFYQEGIHMEVEDGRPFYRGVVFNEMKGAMSGVDDRIEQEMSALLFPESCYRFNSGGNPAVIPNLTYEKFRETYKKVYHPSNAKFFLDGAVPLSKTLQMINAYLDRYDKKDFKKSLQMQKPVCNTGSAFYEISEEDGTENRSILALGKIIGLWNDKAKQLAIKLLCDILAGSNEALLKREILYSGLAEDFEMTLVDGIAQPYLLMVARNVADGESERLYHLIGNTLKSIVNSGISKEMLLASINRMEFDSKRIPEPQGLYRALAAQKSWLYGGDPMLYLEYDNAFNNLRQEAENGSVLQLLSEIYDSFCDFCVLHMLPSATLGAVESETEEKRLAGEYAALSDIEKTSLAERNKQLAQWQQTPDSAEASKTLPALTLSDVERLPQPMKTEVSEPGGIPVLFHRIPTNGIVYLSLYFKLTSFTLEELTAISPLSELFGELPTKKHSAAELQQMLKAYIGLWDFSLEAFGKDGCTESCTPCLTVRAGVLHENLEKAKELIAEILTETDFDDSAKVKEIVIQSYEMARQEAVGNGHSLGIGCVTAHYSAKNAVNEALRGYSSIRSLRKLAKQFDNEYPSFTALVNKMKSECICQNALTVSVTAMQKPEVADMIELFPLGKLVPCDAEYSTKLPQKLGIRIPASIAYAVKGYHLSCENKTMSGSLRVFSNITALAYLWNVVRMQNGAYGAGFPVTRDGGIFCYSYRDPVPKSSLDAYNHISDFIHDFCDSNEDIDKYIISAVAATEPLKSPDAEGFAADELWLSGVSEEDRIKNRSQMLHTDRNDLLSWCTVMDNMAKNGAICVIGNDEALYACKDLTVYEL